MVLETYVYMQIPVYSKALPNNLKNPFKRYTQCAKMISRNPLLGSLNSTSCSNSSSKTGTARSVRNFVAFDLNVLDFPAI